EEFGNGNGHDSTYSYSSADSYPYSDDSSFAEGTTYRSPFTPHRPAGSDYESIDSESSDAGEAGNSLLVGSHDGGYLSASGLAPGSDLPGGDLPATGLTDPGMPEVGFPHAAASYTDTTAASFNDPAALPHPATEPPGSAGTATDSAAGPGDKDSKFGSSDSGRGPDTTATDRGTAFSTAAATAAATVGGISAALRSSKQRGAGRHRAACCCA